MASALYNARLSDVRGAPRHGSGRWIVVASLQMPLLHTGRHIEHRQWLPTANQALRVRFRTNKARKLHQSDFHWIIQGDS